MAISTRRKPLSPLYPPIRPYEKGRLAVSPVHELYYEQSGNPDGKPVVFLHGGPGGGTDARMRRSSIRSAIASCCSTSAAAARARRTRACRTTPPGTWSTTSRSCASISASIAGRCSAVRGARRSRSPTRRCHPAAVTELVLRGIFLLRRSELDWFYQSPEGAASLFPDLWEQFVAPIPLNERRDMIRAYYHRLTSDNRAERNAAARAWSVWEGASSFLRSNAAYVGKFDDAEYAAAFARIECHYFINAGLPVDRRPAAARRRAHPAYPDRHRAGPLRRRLPDAQRMGPAPRVAGSRDDRRTRCRAFGLRTRYRPRVARSYRRVCAGRADEAGAASSFVRKALIRASASVRRRAGTDSDATVSAWPRFG